MARARIELAWDLQSCLLAMLANIHRDPKKRPNEYKPSDFNPCRIAAKKRLQSFKDLEGSDLKLIQSLKRMKKRTSEVK